MREKTSKNTEKMVFYCIFKRTKTSKYYILFNIRLSRSLSALYKIWLYIFCLERLQYMNGKGKERKKWFFEES